ncbi:SEC-C domain-containing protein [Vibrio sp. AK197]
MSDESSKFLELEALCGSDGFIHVYSFLCHRDCTFGFHGGLKSEDLHHLSSPDRLNKNELSMLHGLMLKSGYNTMDITSDELIRNVDLVENILREIHDSLYDFGDFKFNNNNYEELFYKTNFIRESIFYSAEQAFDFQFASFAVERYEKDSVWLKDNIGFDIKEAYDIYKCLHQILNENISHLLSLKDGFNKNESHLKYHEISIEKINELSKVSKDKISCFLHVFSTSSNDKNDSFKSIDDFNIVSTKPIVRVDDKYYLFQLGALAQSLYESPIFWMRADKKYRKSADEHRGDFTEEFTYRKLVSIFGESNVFKNVDIFRCASEKIGEIDVIAKFGSKCLVFQAKSKSMTISSRKGQLELVKDDFTKGFQNAYDQAISCSNALMAEDVVLKDINGEEIAFGIKPTACYPVCITSESYPSLTFQCRQYLEYESTTSLKSPFIMDVFFLDILSEFLSQPLLFLSYVDRRTSYIEKLMASTEIVLLSMHLKRNLWIDSDITLMHLSDDIASELDAAFMVRRLALTGQKTPQGIIQKYTTGFFGKLLFHIQRAENDDLTDLGLTLLKGSGKFVDLLNNAVEKVQYLAVQDGLTHDFSVQLEGEKFGLTVHTISGEFQSAQEKLMSHMHLKKYTLKQNVWFGVLVEPANLGMISAVCKLSYPWEKDDTLEMAANVSGMNDSVKVDPKNFKVKIGRNDRCLCGSGKKYKKCCMQ